MPFPKKQQIYSSDDYWSLPDGQRAELIDGHLYAMAPPDFIHQKLLSELQYTILNYVKSKKGICEVIPAPFAVNLNADDRTWVEPDISVICDKNKIDNKGCCVAPDWIIEIVSPTTQKMDYGIKLFKYRTAGVREYWIVNPMTHTVNVYDFEHEEKTGQYNFNEDISVCIYSDLVIHVAEFL
ncbi:Uma2 family endonuclease [Schaedlerella arabinosiphila]|uniref:Uma2 family endonuclease n=1 Tax=Schaedlerella arabinosiphila TaxID=2044587 RepID=A0A9X5H6V4_9FIRM|nr:Uma2 family endonuclease [Schaedlerella arabinosiphila]NDO69430.1 Uma2 family endonuclease [Schaedlerella arabinosiphila]